VTSQIRAGEKKVPPKASPLVRLLLVMTSELGEFEKDLAASFGPEEAHRLAFAPTRSASRAGSSPKARA
jgi:hypothetical protein